MNYNRHYGEYKLNNKMLIDLYPLSDIRVDYDIKNKGRKFIENSSDEKISTYAANLSRLLDEESSLQKTVELCDSTPEIKNTYYQVILFRLTKGIHYKREYYDKTFVGRIAKIVLKLTGQWNSGETNIIKKAKEVRNEVLLKVKKHHINMTETERANDHFHLKNALWVDGLLDEFQEDEAEYYGKRET